MKKLILASAAAVIFAAPALAQNQGPASTDPDPQVRNELSRDPQQSGGGAVQAGQGPKMGTQSQGKGPKSGTTGQGINNQDGRDNSRDGGIAPSPGYPK